MPETRPATIPALIARHGRSVLRDALVAAVVLFGASFLIPNQYTASTLLLPPSETDDLSSLLSGAAGSAMLSRAFGLTGETKTDLYLGVLRSGTVSGALLKRFDLQTVYRQKDMEKAGRVLARHTKVALTNEGFVRLSVTEKDPKLAADLANGYVVALDQFLTLNTNRGARLRREFLARRLAEARDTLARSEDALRDYQVEHKIALSGDLTAGAEGIGELMAQKLTRELELGTLRSIGVGSNPRASQLQAELAQIDRELERIPPATTAIARLLRDTKVQEKIVLVLTEEYERARLQEMKDVATVEVVDTAAPPLHKSGPRRTFIAIGAFLLAAAASAWMRWVRDGSPARP
jgi:tyrosine-protein kinase Etk/Wzc